MHRIAGTVLAAFMAWPLAGRAEALAPTDLILSGVVVDASSAPASGVAVRLLGNGPTRESRTNERGAYRFDRLSAGSYTLEALSPLGRASEGPIDLTASRSVDLLLTLRGAETVEVVGGRERGYRAAAAPTANKSEAPVKEAPFSVQVVTRDLIEDRGVTTFGEAVRTVPGLTPQVGFLGTNDRFRLRGFATPANLKNGLRRSAFVPINELANVEQVEVLKGPASALYGRFEPGGVVNLVTKRPLGERRIHLDFTGGDDSFLRGTLDATGPLGSRLAYRLTAAWQDNGSFRDFADGETQFVSPVLAWRPRPGTELVFEAEYLRREQGLDRGFGNSPLFLEVPINRNYGEPYARGTSVSRLASLALGHALADRWSLRVAAQATEGEIDGRYVSYGFPAVSGAGTGNPRVNRSGIVLRDRERDWTAQAELTGRFAAVGAAHRVLVGVEVGRTTEDSSFDGAALGPISLLNPVYGQQFGPVVPSTFDTENKTLALYAQDEVAVAGRWRALLGVRYDQADYRTEDSFTQEGRPGVGEAGAFSPRIGLTFTPRAEASLYGSWARSFHVDVFSRLRSGALPRPIDGEQFELGAKLDLFGGRFSPTLAWFDIRRRNGTVPDPGDPTFTFSIQTGEQRSRGFELDLPLVVSSRWRLLASYARLLAEFTRDPRLQGNRLANAPRDNGSLWTTWDLGGRLAGFSLGAGVHYVGEREATNANTFHLPAYTRWDANLAYRFGPERRYRVQVSGQNATDRRYYDSGGSFVPIYPGAPRTITASAGLTF